MTVVLYSASSISNGTALPLGGSAKSDLALILDVLLVTLSSGADGLRWRIADQRIRGGGILLTPLDPGWGVGFGVEGIC